jgi:hypothetical protein
VRRGDARIHGATGAASVRSNRPQAWLAVFLSLFEQGVVEVGFMARPRRKFLEFHTANKSSLAGTALELIRQLYQAKGKSKRQTPKQDCDCAENARLQCQEPTRVVDGPTPTGAGGQRVNAKALDYSVNRWAALTRYLEDPRLPITTTSTSSKSDPGPLAGKTGCCGSAGRPQARRSDRELAHKTAASRRSPPTHIYQFLVSLDEIEPKIWRRLWYPIP